MVVAAGARGSQAVLANKGVKMPKYDLPKFSGQYKDWIPFHDQSKSAVDKNVSIPDFQKLN